MTPNDDGKDWWFGHDPVPMWLLLAAAGVVLVWLYCRVVLHTMG